MILAADAGNTTIFFGLMDAQGAHFTFRLDTESHRTADSYAAAIAAQLARAPFGSAKLEGAVISCVVPQLLPALADAIRLCTGQSALVVTPAVQTGLQILLDDPSQLASDLVAAAVGAIHRYPLPVIVWDIGTASTVSVVDGQGRFRGGAIMSGPVTALRALSHSASLLPDVTLQPPAQLIGSNTEACMRSGFFYGTACMIDDFSCRVEEQLGQPATVVLTGGLSAMLAPCCRRHVIVAETLLLEGLYQIYARNPSPRS